jgi:mevalonate kinase
MPQFASFVTSAPGKIILFGEHAVVHGSHAVATVINERIYAEFSFNPASNADQVVFEQKSLNRQKTYPLAALQSIARDCKVGPSASWLDASRLANIHKAVASADQDPGCIVFLLLFIGVFDAQCGLTCRIESDIPLGSGLGSSASYSVALASGFFKLRELLASGSGTVSPTLDADATHAINQWAFQGEKVLHGDPSGVDNTCATYGGAILFRKHHDTQFFPSLPEIPIILTNTQVEGRSTKRLVEGVAELKRLFPEVVNPILSSIDNVVLTFVKSIGSLNANQQANTGAFLTSTAQLMRLNHHLLNALGVGHRTIDQVVSGGDQHGFVSKTTGAGGGGCVISLVPTGSSGDAPPAFQRAMNQHGFACVSTTIGGKGVLVHPGMTFANRHAKRSAL